MVDSGFEYFSRLIDLAWFQGRFINKIDNPALTGGPPAWDPPGVSSAGSSGGFSSGSSRGVLQEILPRDPPQGNPPGDPPRGPPGDPLGDPLGGPQGNRLGDPPRRFFGGVSGGIPQGRPKFKEHEITQNILIITSRTIINMNWTINLH